MTRARALKQVIRARAAKTGERYTTARRHILRELNQPIPSPAKPDAPPAAAKSAATRPTISDQRILEKTGHRLDHWYALLDRFGGVEKGHTALTRWLHENHGIPGWHCQGIVTSYERARGKRVVNQRCDGAFEVSVSKVLPMKVPALVKKISDAKQRKQWSGRVDAGLLAALDAGLKDSKKGFVIRPDGLARFRYKWDGMTVQLYFVPKVDKTHATATTMKLADADAVATYRMLWKAALAALAHAD